MRNYWGFLLITMSLLIAFIKHWPNQKYLLPYHNINSKLKNIDTNNINKKWVINLKK